MQFLKSTALICGVLTVFGANPALAASSKPAPKPAVKPATTGAGAISTASTTQATPICVNYLTGSLRLQIHDNCPYGYSVYMLETGGGGEPGPQGPAGPMGPQGPAGLQGAIGAQGPAGAPGATGAQGPAGPQGIAGAKGADGAAGPAGPAGAVGPAGPAGAAGAAGPQGEIGPAGAPGDGGLKVFDAANHVVGSLLDSLGGWVLRQVGTDWLALQVAPSGFVMAEMTFYHTAANCQGDRYLANSNGVDFVKVAQMRGITAYYTKASDVLTLLSQENIPYNADPASPGTCETFESPMAGAVGPVVTSSDSSLRYLVKPFQIK
jgi:hypothetical protein